MRFKDSKPVSFISKIFRRKNPNKFKKKSAIGKSPLEERQNSKQTIRSFLSRTSSVDSDVSKHSSSSSNNAGGGGGTFLDFMRLRKKILIFRDIFDIPPLNGSVAIHELVMATIKDLNRMYPDLIAGNPVLKMKEKNTHQGLICLYDVLDCIADSWVEDKSTRDKFKKPHIETSPLDELVEVVLEMLDCINNAAKEKFELMDVQRKHAFPGSIKVKPKPMTDYNSKYSRSPTSISPTSVHPDSPRFADLLGAMLGTYSSPQLLNLRAHAVEKLSPMDLKRLVVHVMPHFAANDNRQPGLKSASHEEDKVEAKDQTTIEPKVGFADNGTEEKKESGGKTDEEKNEQQDNEAKETEEETPAETEDEVVETVQPQPLSSPTETKDEVVEIVQPPPLSSPIETKDEVVETVQPPPLSSPTETKDEVVETMDPPTPPSLPTISLENAVSTPSSPPASIASPQRSIPKFTSPPPPPPPPMADTSSTHPSALRSSNQPSPPPPSPCNSPPRTHSPPPSSASAAPQPPSSSLAPPPPPVPGAAMPPPPPVMRSGGAAPPPPGAMKTIVRPRNRTKLKRSTHMGNLYRLLRGKVEGSCFPGGKPVPGNKHVNNSGNAGGGTSMADALAEMTKRSAYFQQIEGDMEKHGNAIKELQSELNAFKTSDMDELLKFHNHVESLLELLTDESQILSRFESFPMKKLETLRVAAALSTKLNGIVSEIQNWKIDPPLSENLNKVEKFFNKIKSELEGIERTKDEESRKFQGQNIHFDFSIFTKIKESMVDLSSGFIELALKERSEAKAQAIEKTDGTHVKMLWRAFQFAFKVYSFAGGQDERADSLTRQLAKEIETDQMQE